MTPRSRTADDVQQSVVVTKSETWSASSIYSFLNFPRIFFANIIFFTCIVVSDGVDCLSYLHILVESFLRDLGHLHQHYSPYNTSVTSSLASSEIPITQTYPDVIVDLRGARVRVEVRAKARVTRGLRASSPKSNVSACAARPFHDVIATCHY